MLRSILFWILAVIITIGCLSYQDKTGPTYPLEDTIEIFGENVNFKFLRSETIGTDLQIMLQDPVPAGISGYVKYRRFKSNDEWATVQMEAGSFEFRRRWEVQTVQGTGAKLPSLLERAGKYEFFVYITKENAEPISVTGDKPIYARYKAKVPAWALLVHILTIFISMAIGIRTVLEALVNGNYKWIELTALNRINNPAINGVLLNYHDITERKSIEEAMRKQKDMFELVINSVPTRIFWKDLNSVYLGCNISFLEAVRKNKIEDVIGKNDFDLIWAKEAEKYINDDRHHECEGQACPQFLEPEELWRDHITGHHRPIGPFIRS